jgi:hypothetical protein
MPTLVVNPEDTYLSRCPIIDRKTGAKHAGRCLRSRALARLLDSEKDGTLRPSDWIVNVNGEARGLYADAFAERYRVAPDFVPKDLLTGDDVLGLWLSMTQRHNTYVVAKASAEEMKLAAAFLGGMGIMDAESFLENYTTTIGRAIYVNFEIGVDMSSGRSLAGQVRTCGHEHKHYLQFAEAPEVFVIEYGLIPADRARYELDAYQVSMEIHYWLTGGDLLDPAGVARKLKAYALKDEDCAFVEQGLKSTAATLQASPSPRAPAVSHEVSREVIRRLSSRMGLPA